MIYALVIVLPVALPVLYLAWRGSGLATGPMIVSQSSSRPAPTTNQFERAMWSFMRLSGFVMIILVFMHITMMHFINDIEQITGQFVYGRFAALPAWAWIDLAILFFAWLHGLNGLRIVLTDYIRRGTGRKVVLWIVGVFGIAWFVLGAGGVVLRAAECGVIEIGIRRTGIPMPVQWAGNAYSPRTLAPHCKCRCRDARLRI